MNVSPLLGSAAPNVEQPQRVRFDALDAARWVASAQIVGYHLSIWARPAFSDVALGIVYRGRFWTQMFFILSGFVLAYAELSKPPKERRDAVSTFSYVTRRLSSIYPLYLLSLLLIISNTYTLGINHSAFTWDVLPLHFLLMQAWYPVNIIGTQVAWFWNGEAWFLSCLVFYWPFLRPITRVVRYWSASRCAWSLFCTWCVSEVVVLVCVQLNFGHLWTPIGYFHVFLAGILAARLFIVVAMVDENGGISSESTRLVVDTSRTPFLLRYGCVFGYGIYFATFFMHWVPAFASNAELAPYELSAHPEEANETNATLAAELRPWLYWAIIDSPIHNGGLIPIMVLVIVGAAAGKDPIAKYILMSPPMRFLGSLSYAQYILQRFTWQCVNCSMLGMTVTQKLYVFPAVHLLVAYVASRCVERPFNEWYRGRQKARS